MDFQLLFSRKCIFAIKLSTQQLGRILAIDYGLKRTGLAVTDPLQIIASPLETISSSNLIAWIQDYILKAEVEGIVIGMPTKPDNSETQITKEVKGLISKLNSSFPDITITEIDERFTSKLAKQTLILGGMKKRDRQKKGNVDKVSAAIILQTYLSQNS